MNKSQEIVLWVGIAVIVFVGLNSPLNSSCRLFLGEGAGAGAAEIATKIHNIGQLYMRWTMTAIVTAGLICTLRDKKPKLEQKR